MDTTITTEPGRKRAQWQRDRDRPPLREAGRQASQILRPQMPGLYVSITTAGVATFSFKFTDPETGTQRTGRLGIYNPETFTIEDARNKVYGLLKRSSWRCAH